MDVRLKGQAVIKRNMKRYSVLLLGMHENSLDSSEVEEAERRLDDALWVARVEINQCVGGLRPCSVENAGSEECWDRTRSCRHCSV